MLGLSALKKKLSGLKDAEKAKVLQGFFKTGPGEYGEGDVFIGVVVPKLRALAKEFSGLTLPEAKKLLQSPVHEERLLALLILVLRFSRGDEPERKKIYQLYLGNSRYVNNWDLVDLTAPHIAGAYLADKNRSPLYTLAVSKSLWQRRIAIVATFHYIRQKSFSDTFKIAVQLLDDPEDLIHKACGWMLREAGKRDAPALEAFLKKHHRQMPRVMLRYAIEKFPPSVRKVILSGKYW